MNVPHSLILEQKENAKHGEVFFPIQKYITKLNLNSPVIMTHWHEEAELTLITKGSCIYQIDLVDYEVNEGDLLFIPPLLLHSIRLNGTDDFCSETYVFHVNFLGGNATDICSTRYLTPMINHELTLPYHISSTHPAHHSLHECFIKMASLYTEQTFGYEIALKSVLLQALFLLLQYSTTESATISASSDKLKNVLDYIDLHYAEPLTISELAELCYFSPLRDAALPQHIGGLYLPGGYPELYAAQLAANTAMRCAINTAVQRGLPTVAECGGFLYLGQTLEDDAGTAHPMAGVLPGEGFRVGRLVRFGYAALTPQADSMLFRAGEPVPVHEFHHWDSTCNGTAFAAQKANGRHWDCGFANGHLYAGFPHLYWAGTPLPQRFVTAAAQYAQTKTGRTV